MIEIAPLAQSASELTLPRSPIAAQGARLSFAPPLARFALRARDAARLGQLLGRPIPQRIGEAVEGVIKLGPDEWLALLPAGTVLPDGKGEAVSIVDIGARSVGLLVEGPDAAALIATGCPLDLERMETGRATRTLFETVEILLWRQDAERFHLDVWRSYAPWLCTALAASLGA